MRTAFESALFVALLHAYISGIALAADAHGLYIGGPAWYGHHTFTGALNARPGVTIMAKRTETEPLADQFYFVYETWTGDFDVCAQLAQFTSDSVDSESFIMAREGALQGNLLTHTSSDRFISLLAKHSSSNQMQYIIAQRDAIGGAGFAAHADLGTAILPNAWLRLRRQGNVFTAFTSTNGSSWIQGHRIDTSDWPSGPLDAILSVGLGVIPRTDKTYKSAQVEFNNLAGFSFRPPQISSTLPIDGANFVDTFTDLTFKVTSSAEVPMTNLSLVVNGVDKTGSLLIVGNSYQWHPTFQGGLELNTFYSIQFSAIDVHSLKTVVQSSFDTFDQGNLMIEAEDFNFDGGKFIDNPVIRTVELTDNYVNKVGIQNIDRYKRSPAGEHDYRMCDELAGTGEWVATEPVGQAEILRQKYIDARRADPFVIDFNVGWIFRDEWLNYTRTFPDGVYCIYARLARDGSGPFLNKFDKVLSGSTTTNQTLAPLGIVSGVGTGGWQIYKYFPLTDPFGNETVHRFSGIQTVRFTHVSWGINANYFMFVPASDPGFLPLYIARASPMPGATGVTPDAPIMAAITDRDTTVRLDSIRLFVNDVDVTSEAMVSKTLGGAELNYEPRELWELDSTNRVKVIYSDDADPANTMTNQWQFATAIHMRIIPASYAYPVGAGYSSGFTIRVLQTSQDNLNNSTKRAEEQLAGVYDVISFGFETPQVINYNQDAPTGYGNFGNDKPIPGIPGPTGSTDYIAAEVVAYLALNRGVYRMGVNSDDGFRLTTGKVPSEIGVVLGEWNGGRGASDTMFSFLVQTNGVYAFRFVWWEGQGGANFEWFSEDLETGVRTLINDPGVATSIKAYRFNSAMAETVTITKQPANTTAYANQTATFSLAAETATVTNPVVFAHQWQVNRVDIPGANRPTYKTPLLTLSDNRSRYRSIIILPGYPPVTSDEAMLTISMDNIPPQVVSVKAGRALDNVILGFNRPMDETSAATLSNYQLSGGLMIINAYRDRLTNIVLKTTQQTPGTSYEITINNLLDMSLNPIMPNTKKTFSSVVLMPGFAIMELFTGINGNSVSNLTSTEKFIRNEPDVMQGITSLESPWNCGDRYGGRLSAIITAPETGNFTFLVFSDESSELWLSANEKPASKQIIAFVDGWTGRREWDKFPSQTSPPQALIAGQKYYIEALWKEGEGGDGAGIGWQLPSAPGQTEVIDSKYLSSYFNPDLSVISINQQPQSVTVVEYRKATFTVVATGVSELGSALSYQWQRNGVDIPGATGASYTTPLLTMADNGGKYRVKITVPGKTVTSAEAVLTIRPVIDPPKALSAGSISNVVAIKFDRPMHSVSIVPENFFLKSAAVTAAELQSDGRLAELRLNIALVEDEAIGFIGITDLAGNAISGEVIIQVNDLISADVGTKVAGQFTDPLQPGTAYPTAKGEFEVVAGGSDIWNNTDGFHFVYKEVEGDFDVKVRVSNLDRTDHWSKAGLMIRETLDGDSRNLNMVVDPTAGANVWEQNRRQDTAGSSSGWPDTFQDGPVTYPNAWLRLIRNGNVFEAWRSSDGVKWQRQGRISPATAYPAKVYVGMATTAHNNSGVGTSATAQYHDFVIGPYVAPPPVPNQPRLQGKGPQGLIVLEAENFDFSLAAGGHEWVFTTDHNGYSGAGAMRAMPNNGRSVNANYETGGASPRLDYKVKFDRPGTYYVWIRSAAASYADDSVHVGLNRQELATSERIVKGSGVGFSGWSWTKATLDGALATIEVTNAGIHLVNVWMREDGFYLDKIVLTLDPDYDPSTVNCHLGPTEPPLLSIELVGGDMVVSWKAVLGAGFVLEATVNLSQPTWEPVTQAPVEVGGRSEVILPAGTGMKFLRLKN